MLSQLPERADPKRLCEQGKAFAGQIALGKLPRLTPLLTSSEGEAAFTLVFDRDEEQRFRIRGTVRANLSIRCERCLQGMALPVDVSFTLSPVNGPMEAEALPDEYDPLLTEDSVLQLADLVEDELILAIPPAPRHPAETCGVDLADFRRVASVAQKPSEVRENPFAVLANWKRDDE